MTKNSRQFVRLLCTIAALGLNKILQKGLLFACKWLYFSQNTHFCSGTAAEQWKQKQRNAEIWFKPGRLRQALRYKEPAQHRRGPTPCLRSRRQSRPSPTQPCCKPPLSRKAAIKVCSAEADRKGWLLFRRWALPKSILLPVQTTRSCHQRCCSGRWFANHRSVGAAADVTLMMYSHTCTP